MNPSTSTAISCLLNDDIFQIIADFLCDTQRKRTLASLARTCKALHQASIPVLWVSQDSFVPLLRLLPSDASTERRVRYHQSVLAITQRDKLEWTRFDHYAQHVRRFHWTLPSDILLVSLSALLSHRPGGQPLLPQLRTLVWHELCAQHFSLIHLFLTPTIRRLSLTSKGLSKPDVLTLFDNVAAACKDLEYFSMYMHSGFGKSVVSCTGVVGDAFARLLRGMSELQLYSGDGDLSTGCIEALAALPKLKMLQLDMKDTRKDTVPVDASGRRLRPRNGPWFPALEFLWITMGWMDESTRLFMDAIQSPSLQQLLITVHKQPDTFTLKQHLAGIARAPFRDSLTTLQLDCEDYEPTSTLLVGDALQPIYALAQIHTLIVRGFVLVVDSCTLRGIAHAWTQLQVISLTSAPEDEPVAAPRGTLEDLVQFARKCPRLHGLELELRADEVPDATALTVLLPEPSQSPLQHLVVHNAPVSDPGQVADFLARVFPALSNLGYFGPSVHLLDDAELAYEDKWGTVGDLLAARLAAGRSGRLQSLSNAYADSDPFEVVPYCLHPDGW